MTKHTLLGKAVIELLENNKVVTKDSLSEKSRFIQIKEDILLQYSALNRLIAKLYHVINPVAAGHITTHAPRGFDFEL